MKVLIATQKPFAASAVSNIFSILAKAGHQAGKLEAYTDQSALKCAVRDVDAMIVRSDLITREVFDAAPHLKIVVRAGAGYDNIDLPAATERGIVVMNTPGQNSNAVAELAIAMMIFISRAQFTPETGTEIQGKTLGIQAFGNVGRLVGAKAKALGMKVNAIDPFLSAEQILQGGAQPVESLEELYSSCDFVSVHIPATSQTMASIGYDLVSSMPKGGVLVNTARKEVIDEDGLLRALTERTDLKYITDVAPSNFETMRRVCGQRVFATPQKMGAQTREANINAGLAAAGEIADFFLNGNTQHQVNK